MSKPHVLLLAGLFAAGCHAEKPWSMAAADPSTERILPNGEIVMGGESRAGGHAWLGLPFAAPPIGELRWRAPRPPPPFAGTRFALNPASACAQFASPISGIPGVGAGEPAGSEDCLYLNVFAPKLTPGHLPHGKERLPVMFWIHGGGNSVGTASFYDPSVLAQNDGVIVVTTQYRLGPMGWFRHPSLRAGTQDVGEQSGNFGTLDLVRGLEWVRDNIASFGGDPGNVTIFGESAGGMDVYTMLLAPKATGLFHRAIVESGGLSEFSPDEAEHFTDDKIPGHKNSSNEVLLRLLMEDGHAADRSAAKARLAAMSEKDVATYLRSRSPVQLLMAYKTNRKFGMIDMPLVFRDGSVLPAGDWTDVLADRQGWNHVPVIVGSNKDEDKLFLFFDPQHVKQRLGFLPRYVNEPNYHATSEYLSRSWKCSDVDRPASAMRRSGATDIYAYRFDWHGEPTVLGADLGKMLGAAHSFEIPFVFGRFDLGKQADKLFDEKSRPEREALSKAMRSYWTQFARTGSPGSGRGSDLPQWSAWDDSAPEKPKFVLFDDPAPVGIRMVSTVETREHIYADIDADARLPTQLDKCRVFRQLVGWTHGLTRDAYPKVGKIGCAEYPFDAYPWEPK
jgi:para-nitrobenzyl esterase